MGFGFNNTTNKTTEPYHVQPSSITWEYFMDADLVV